VLDCLLDCSLNQEFWTWIIIAKSLYKFCVGDQIHMKCIINIEMEQYISIWCVWQANWYLKHWSYNNEDNKLKTSYQLLNHVLIKTIHKLWKFPIPLELDVFWWTWWWQDLLQKDGTPYTHNNNDFDDVCLFQFAYNMSFTHMLNFQIVVRKMFVLKNLETLT